MLLCSINTRALLLSSVVAGLVLSSAGCGRNTPATSGTSSVHAIYASGSLGRQHTSAEYSAALAAAQSAQCPAGVDPNVYGQLRAALLSALQAQVDGRGASALPGGNENQLDDVSVADLGAGDYQMTWTYKNRGDLDLNGEVNVADLTPIGQHYHATAADPNWLTVQAADGDLNGEVNLADVTTIGQHYLAQVAGYNIYGGDSQTGPWTAVGSVNMADGDRGSFPPQFTFHIGVSAYTWFLCAPRDFTGFDGVGGGGGTGGTATVELGTTTPGPSATIGSGGGVVQGEPGTPLEGVKVTVPVGSFGSDTVVTLGTNSGSVVPSLGTASGVIIDISANKVPDFNLPVTITAPLNGDQRLPVPYYIDEDNQLHLCQIKSWDPAGGTFSFETWHFSPYTWLMSDPVGTTTNLDGTFDSKFLPSKDGFFISNAEQTKIYPDGRCAGFTAFAQWWYAKKKASKGDFINQYITPVGGNYGNLSGQSLIASRAYSSVSNRLWLTVGQDVLSDQGVYAMTRNAIANTGLPQMVRIQSSLIDNFAKDCHSVMAFKADNGRLSIYDPNHPGDNGYYIEMDGTSVLASFKPYNDGPSYVNFWCIGDGSIDTREAYEHIYQDAENNFNNSEKAQITITSHTDGASVTERNTTLAGSITSAELLIDELDC